MWRVCCLICREDNKCVRAAIKSVCESWCDGAVGWRGERIAAGMECMCRLSVMGVVGAMREDGSGVVCAGCGVVCVAVGRLCRWRMI